MSQSSDLSSRKSASGDLLCEQPLCALFGQQKDPTRCPTCRDALAIQGAAERLAAEHPAAFPTTADEMRAVVVERDVLRRAIVEHRTAIHNAGTVRVDHRDEPIAAAKHNADLRLWGVIENGA